MVAEVTAWVFNMVAVLVLWSASLPCPIKYEFDFFLTTCGISLMEQCQWVVMLKLKMIELNVPCAVIFFSWFLISLFSELPFCSLFMICFRLLFCFAQHYVVWLGDDVTLLGKSLFLFWLTMMSLDPIQPVLSWLLSISWYWWLNDIASLHSTSAGMLDLSGFPKGLFECSFHWANCLMGMWHMCALAFGAKDTLELFLGCFMFLH